MQGGNEVNYENIIPESLVKDLLAKIDLLQKEKTDMLVFMAKNGLDYSPEETE